MRKFSLNFCLLNILTLISCTVYAHIGSGTNECSGFLSGFTHPLSGLDHLLAMLAVGLWAGQNKSKILWIAPLSFIVFMVIGAIAGIFGLNLPMGEIVILISLVVFGSLIALTVKPNTILAMFIIGIFAIFHGHVHGTEIAATSLPLMYTLGFVLSTGLLHLVGIAISKFALLEKRVTLSSITGGSIMVAGILMLCLLIK